MKQLELSLDDGIIAQFDHVELEREQMHDYQSDRIVPFLKENPFSFLMADMGLGKSCSTATAFTDLLSEFVHEGKILIVGPLKVATDTWPTEFKVWRHLAPFTVTLLREADDDPRLKEARRLGRVKGAAICDDPFFEITGADKTRQMNWYSSKYETVMRHRIRRELASTPTSIHVINFEQLEWLVYHFKGDWPYRTVILDESSKMKDIKSNRWLALSKTRQTEGLITRMHLLSATPAAETYEHLFAQIYLLDLGKRFGKKLGKFRERYFTYNQYSQKYKLRPDAEEEILAKIADICLVMKADDYLKRDKPTIAPRRVVLSDESMALYESMKNDFIVTLPGDITVESKTAAALSSKLLQMASGVLYETMLLEDYETGDFEKIRKVHHIHDDKIEMLREIVDELEGEPLIVAYHHKSSLARLQKAFPNATTMDREGKCIKDWNKKKIPMLLCHPQSAGHGLNMQKGGHNIVFFDIPWSLENYLQMIGRIDRQGQLHPVLVQLLIAVGTIDEYVWQSLRQKNDAQERLFVFLKRLIEVHRSKRIQQIEELI